MNETEVLVAFLIITATATGVAIVCTLLFIYLVCEKLKAIAKPKPPTLSQNEIK